MNYFQLYLLSITDDTSRNQVPVRLQEGIPRRAQIARNQRNRGHGNVSNQPAEAAESESEGEDASRNIAGFNEEKMGAKKRAKLEAKAEKRMQREHELQLREEKKKKEELLADERKKTEQKEEEEIKKREEAERLAREEKERQEYEEYLKMKEAFSVEEEGFDENDESESENQLQQFVRYIKEKKVVVLEDLASTFKLKTQATIDRITDLQNDGVLTGVIDDRGKFIFISEQELLAVAKFIKQRGRVSILELAESSNNLINLKPIINVE